MEISGKNLIKGWKDIKVGTYQEILKREYREDDPDGIYDLVGLLYGLTKDEVLDLPLEETAALIKSVEFLQKRPRPILVRPEYDLGGHKYVFKSEAGEITTAQYIDFNNTNKKAENMAELLAIFLVPKGKAYNKGYDFREVVNDIEKHLSVPEALSMSDFFIYRWRALLKRTATETKKALRAARKDGAITKEQEKEGKEKIDQLTDMYGSII